jgi:hypothetical protein
VDLAGVCLDKCSDSPPAGRNWTSFWTKMWLCEPHFCPKDKKCTMLPQAILAFRSGTRMEQAALRKSCKSAV